MERTKGNGSRLKVAPFQRVYLDQTAEADEILHIVSQ
jgi:hypothetical protein